MGEQVAEATLQANLIQCMQTYRITAHSTVFQTIEVDANSAQEAERMVEQALNSGEAWDDPKFKYIASGGEDDEKVPRPPHLLVHHPFV
jgi:hypothetical protein